MLLPYLSIEVAMFQVVTAGFSPKEVGAYILLVIAAWNAPENSLPDDERQLARMARCTTGEWAKVRPVVMARWHRAADGRWHTEWLDDKRAWAIERSGKARESADRRWLKENETDHANAQRPLSRRIANYNKNYKKNNNSFSWERVAAPRQQPLRLSGADGMWKMRLQRHRPGAEWPKTWGPSPESSEDNVELDETQRREWRKHYGYPPDWRAH